MFPDASCLPGSRLTEAATAHEVCLLLCRGVEDSARAPTNSAGPGSSRNPARLLLHLQTPVTVMNRPQLVLALFSTPFIMVGLWGCSGGGKSDDAEGKRAIIKGKLVENGR